MTSKPTDRIETHLQQSPTVLGHATKNAWKLACSRAVAQSRADRPLVIGNGDSVDEAQRPAAEIVGCDDKQPPDCRKIARTTDSSALTLIADDRGCRRLLAGQIKALGRTGNVLLASAACGSLPNILTAPRPTPGAGQGTAGFPDVKGEALGASSGHLLPIPGGDRPAIQQIRIGGPGSCEMIKQPLMDIDG